ncbi:nucleoside ABC transporter membrane protein [Actinocorallia herbida]|uniref:Nucleoside ABC transporter membrane protein n=1 Tax=Actinocorallia herbida TaxID=58109 RepID=A0A3N1CSY4_9ACTN|nr:ABC transporter permease [Actinocorallia herbida]ROO84427.1 nucleoside ABC transporter membrane protein [Actinocorallia herbida]
MDRDAVTRLIRRIGMPVLAVVLALGIGGGLVATLGHSPLTAASTVIDAGFSCGAEYCNLGGTLALAGPIILCALGAVVSLRSGLFSIGQEGQYALGGLAAAVAGSALSLPGGLHPVVALGAAVLVGAAWGAIPALLKVFLGVNELIITIVLNAMAGLLLDFLVNHPLRAEASTVGYTRPVDASARLPVFDPSTKFGLGFVIAVLACAAVWFFLSRTTTGYEQRMSGEATAFARYSGMSSTASVLRAGLIGGALAGLGGGVQVLGTNYRVIEGFADGTGFTGLTAAILGGTTALGAGLAGVLYAGITVGAVNGLQIVLGVPREIGSTTLALMIVLVALQAPLLARFEAAINRRRAGGRRGDPPDDPGSPLTTARETAEAAP